MKEVVAEHPQELQEVRVKALREEQAGPAASQPGRRAPRVVNILKRFKMMPAHCPVFPCCEFLDVLLPDMPQAGPRLLMDA